MEPGIALVVLVIVGIPIALAIWLIVRAVNSKNRIEELSHRLGELESEIFRLKREKESPRLFESAPAPTSQAKIVTPAPVAPPPPAVTPQPVVSLPRSPVATPPPISVTAATPKSPTVF
jgi:type II secretory pathway pseudopilin PulG